MTVTMTREAQVSGGPRGRVTPRMRLLTAALLVCATSIALPASAHAAPGCDLEVNNRAALTAAVQSTANAGKTICADAGDYGPSSLVWTVDQPAMTRILANPANSSVSIPGSIFRGASNLTVEGFNVTGGSSVESNAAHIRLQYNTFQNMTADVLDFHEGNSDVWFVGNVVQNIRYTGASSTGYGLQTFGGPTNGLHVNYNTFDMGGNSGDGLQLGDVHDFEIVGNIIKNVTWAGAGGSDPHADAIMLWEGASRGLVKDNRISDSNDTLWSGSTSDVRLENNLIVRMKGLCHDGGPTGTSNAGLVRYTWTHNTVYDCGSFWNNGGFGGGYGLGSKGPATAGASNSADHNIFTSLDTETSSQWASEDYNVIVRGTRLGAHDIALVPVFADRIDYRAVNLPFDAGYHVAPAGAPGPGVAPAAAAPAPIAARRKACSGLKGKRLAKCRLAVEMRHSCRSLTGSKLKLCRKRVAALVRCRKIKGTSARAKGKRAACRRKAQRIGRT
jgi:hypothetical protein